MANELAIAMRDAGTELAETFANRDSSGLRTRYGTVMANNGATLDVELAGGSVSGVPMTTACAGAKAGDRVLLTVDGPLVTATGILATGDNGPYVVLYSLETDSVWSPPGRAPVPIKGSGNLAEFAYLEVYGSTGEWKRCYCKVPRVGSAGYDTMYFTLMAFNGSGTNAYIKMTDFEITHDSSSWTISPVAYNEMSTGGNVLEAIGPSIRKVVGIRG